MCIFLSLFRTIFIVQFIMKSHPRHNVPLEISTTKSRLLVALAISAYPGTRGPQVSIAGGESFRYCPARIPRTHLTSFPLSRCLPKHTPQSPRRVAEQRDEGRSGPHGGVHLRRAASSCCSGGGGGGGKLWRRGGGGAGGRRAGTGALPGLQEAAAAVPIASAVPDPDGQGPAAGGPVS